MYHRALELVVSVADNSMAMQLSQAHDPPEETTGGAVVGWGA